MRTPKKKTFLNHVWQYFQSWSGSPASRCQTYQRIVLLGNDSIALRRSSCSVTFGNGNNTSWHDLNVFSRCICTQQDGQWPSLIRKSSHRVSNLLLNDYLNVDQDYTLFCFFCTKCILRNSRFSISYFHKVAVTLKLWII